jgi:hypothetical protein
MNLLVLSKVWKDSSVTLSILLFLFVIHDYSVELIKEVSDAYHQDAFVSFLEMRQVFIMFFDLLKSPTLCKIYLLSEF